MFAWSVIYPTKGKHSREREHPLWTVRSFRFHAENSCIKYNNNNNNCLLILQAWPVKLCKNQKKATYFKNRPRPKCTEKTNRGTVAN